MYYAKPLVKKVSVTHCFGMAIFRRLANPKMRNPTKKFLTLLLTLAVACLPLQAFACEMNPGQAMDHSATQMSSMDHSAMPMSHMDPTAQAGGAGANCCDPQAATASGDCASFMHCGSCVAATPLFSHLPQAALVSLHILAVTMASGEIAPSHASPPYHPPTLS
jgi:hypothetical protein